MEMYVSRLRPGLEQVDWGERSTPGRVVAGDGDLAPGGGRASRQEKPTCFSRELRGSGAPVTLLGGGFFSGERLRPSCRPALLILCGGEEEGPVEHGGLSGPVLGFGSGLTPLPVRVPSLSSGGGAEACPEPTDRRGIRRVSPSSLWPAPPRCPGRPAASGFLCEPLRSWAQPVRSKVACAAEASQPPDTSAALRYFSMSKALSSPALRCSASSTALRSASICGEGKASQCGPELLAGPTGRFLALLLLLSSTIMAASCDGSVLTDASAMAEAMVLMLSIRWLLVLLREAELWSPGLETEASRWAGGAALPPWSLGRRNDLLSDVLPSVEYIP
ncbi:hypothetical protein EYF80_050586 [Liparis tanakae]|uniref:Uncharacterized protein n=1 Tax=Liparis tanakae TaxID=230148 RepID=A0A4Z2FFR6_9TELE|nr:hypothetical protein EYF80_050586 [Liparis tanakae]